MAEERSTTSDSTRAAVPPRRPSLRIALLSPDAPDPRGAERARIVAAEAAGLAARGHSVVTPPWAGAAELGAALVRDGVEVAHVHGVGAGVAVALAARLPVVVSCLEVDGLAPEAAVQADLAAALRVVFPSVAHVVRVREHQLLHAGRVRVVPPGHGLGGGRRPRPRPYDGRGPLRVFHPGPFVPGADDLAAALEALPAGLVEVIALGQPGPGHTRHGWLELHPRGDDRALARLAARCHLAALPSRRQESYALALDEVFALGLPAWVTCGTVAAERYDRGAFEAFPTCSPDAWGKALAGLVRAPERSARAFAALPEEVPTAADAAAALERLYLDTLATAESDARAAA